MKQFFLLVLIAVVVGVGFYIFLAPNPVMRSVGNPSQASPTPASEEPLANTPVATPAATPFPSRQFWPTEVTLKVEALFTQTAGHGEIKTTVPAGTVVQIEDIVAGMLTAKRAGMTMQINVADTDFAERVAKIQGIARDAAAERPSDNEATTPTGQAETSKAPIVFVSKAHHATPPATPAPASTLPPAVPANTSGPIGRYNGLATGNIMVIATPSTVSGVTPGGTTRDPSSGAEPHGGKVMEVRLSENGVAGAPAQVEFFIVVKPHGSNESIVPKQGTPDPSTPGRWIFDMTTEQSSTTPPAPDAAHGNDSRILGWFVRAVRNGRVIGYCASSFNYEQYAMNPALVNPSPAR